MAKPRRYNLKVKSKKWLSGYGAKESIQGCQIYLVKKIPKRGTMYQMNTKFTQWLKNIPNGKNIPFQGPQRYTQIGTFVMKISHLAALDLRLRSGTNVMILKIFSMKKNFLQKYEFLNQDMY
jgi:hypothetical protein